MHQHDKITSFTGGANHPIVETGDNEQHNGSSSSSTVTEAVPQAAAQREGTTPFLGKILSQKRQQQFIPKKLRQTLQEKAIEGLELMQKTSSQLGPSLLTIWPIVGYNSDKEGVTFITLYALALFGASCGFHLFLYFITLGYALGVTLPLAFALSVYQVSFCGKSLIDYGRK
jgi:hypothetical protein